MSLQEQCQRPAPQEGSCAIRYVRRIPQRYRKRIELEIHKPKRENPIHEEPIDSPRVPGRSRRDCRPRRTRRHPRLRRHRTRTLGNQVGGGHLLLSRIRPCQDHRNDPEPEDALGQHQGRSPETEPHTRGMAGGPQGVRSGRLENHERRQRRHDQGHHRRSAPPPFRVRQVHRHADDGLRAHARQHQDGGVAGEGVQHQDRDSQPRPRG